MSLFDGLSLRLNIDRGVAVCCGNTSVAQPLADGEYVDTRPQQMYRGAVPHAVGVRARSRIGSLGFREERGLQGFTAPPLKCAAAACPRGLAAVRRPGAAVLPVVGGRPGIRSSSGPVRYRARSAMGCWHETFYRRNVWENCGNRTLPQYCHPQKSQ